MEELYQLSIALATLLQEAYPRLLGLMTFVSALGSEEFFLVFLPAIYWSIDKRLGRQLGYIFLLSALINNMLKNMIRQPRPFWLEPDIKQGDAEGYGIPSGHVQNVTAVFLLLAASVRRNWAWLLALLYILLMALSRLYLGVHFLQDIAIGFAVGLLVFGAFLMWQQTFFDRYSKQILGRRLLLMVLIPVVLAVVYIGALLLLGPPNMDVPWASFIPAAELNGHEDVVSTVAGLLGFGVGILLESSRIRFRAGGPIWQRVIRYLLGIAVAIGIWAGLRAVFPTEPVWLALPMRFLRYLLLLLWVTYIAPWFFVKLRLAGADTESEVRVTL
jgi:membrane-associated phospholipid phosphatase